MGQDAAIRTLFTLPKCIFGILFLTLINHLEVDGQLTTRELTTGNPQLKFDFTDTSNYLNITMSPELSNGNYEISIVLLSFDCPGLKMPYIYIESSETGGAPTRWTCTGPTFNDDWEAIKAFSAGKWVSIEKGYELVTYKATLTANLYQNSYSADGKCAPGYFDCRASIARCISERLVCDGVPSCGMLSNLDEMDEACDSVATTTTTTTTTTFRPAPLSSMDDAGTSIWVYLGPALGVPLIFTLILFCFIRRRREALRARILQNGTGTTVYAVPAILLIEVNEGNDMAAESGQREREGLPPSYQQSMTSSEAQATPSAPPNV